MWARRQVLAAAGAVAATVVTGDRLPWPDVRLPLLGPRPGQAEDEAWPEPEVRRSEGGRLDVTLTAAPATWTVGGVEISTNLYNDSAPGPTLRVRPGDTLRILLRNEMEQATNLHVHGMHVSPREPGDNIYHSIASGEEYQYEYQIPEDHPPGTYWYHPHEHPHNAEQVGGGMAGMIQVVGALDELPAVRDAVERQIVMQGTFVKLGKAIDGGDLADDWFNPVPVPDREVSPAAAAQGSFETAGVTDDMPPSTLGYYQVHPVNGVVQPRLTVRSGSVERWRIVNASFAMAAIVELEGHQLNVIATDGNPLESVHGADQWVLPPAGRIDVLITPTKPGRYALRTKDMSAYNPDPIYYVQDDADTANERLLLEMVVEGEEAEPAAVPTRGVPGYETDLRQVDVDRQRKVESTKTDGDWSFDNKLWKPDRIDHTVSLWAVEEWVFTDTSGKMHPIHFHVNPFQVVAVNGQDVDEPGWRDTAILPNKGSLTLRMYFRDFSGKYPMHCHNLNHADGGMMQNLEVKDDGTYSERDLP